jgi:ubiquinone/menaquinone biosynthesis C-methylase UbiE
MDRLGDRSSPRSRALDDGGAQAGGSADTSGNGGRPASMPILPFTGERIVPGMVAGHIFREHEVRYVFATAFVKGKRVLDVACGSGMGTNHLLQAGALSCIGLDIDRGATDYARAMYKECTFAQCDVTQMCIGDASVDVVVSFETIEHVNDQRAFLLECERVLRPGGVLVCSTPNRTLSRWGLENPFHFQELNVAELAQLLGGLFSEVQLYSQMSQLYPLYVSRKVVFRWLDRLHLTELVRGITRRKYASGTPTKEFKGSFNDLNGEVQPYRPSLFRQPMFAIGVARKSAS